MSDIRINTFSGPLPAELFPGVNQYERINQRFCNLVNTAEENQTAKEQTSGTQFREKLHLMPPVGWLNDPNGLVRWMVCSTSFSSTPITRGGVKMWGHYTSTNLIDWEYKGVSLYPDPAICTATVLYSRICLPRRRYNVSLLHRKCQAGRWRFDYINTGREANTVLVTTKDGIHFGSKKELLRNSDYPSDLTCHVRDPKVWKKDDIYYMIQGARTKNDVGQALIFESSDKINWHFRSRIESEKPFGYMWECPDYFENGRHQILSSSVQGLEGKEWADRNVYQSGYFLVDGDILDSYKLSPYHLWIMVLTITLRRASKQKMEDASISAGWECRIAKNIPIRPSKTDGSTALHFQEKSS